MIDVRTEKDIEKLRGYALLLVEELERLQGLVAELRGRLGEATGKEKEELELKIKLLDEQLRARERDLYEARSEKRRPERSGSAGEGKAPRTGHGPHEQPKLPRREKVYDLDEPDKICPQCGEALKEWEGQFEEAEEIDVEEVRYVVLVHKRKKYRCRCGACVETAIGPAKLIPGGHYSIEFASHVAVAKYADHLPLSRQVERMARADLEITSQTLWDQLDAQAERIEPTYAALGDYVRSAEVIGLDDTRWPVSERDQERKLWNVWAITRDEAVFYQIDPSRSASAAGRIVQDYSGIVMADGAKANESLERLSKATPEGAPRFRLVQCWAHVRRKFVAAEKDYPEAGQAAKLIGELYRIEAEADQAPPGEGKRLRAALRTARSRPVIEQIRTWLTSTTALPGSSLGRAIKYAAEHWPRLIAFLDDPRIPLDNNATERALRRPVVGRKNHYGSRSRRGTEVAAIFYSLIESAKLAGLDPAAYLAELTRRSVLNPGTIYLPQDMVADQAAQKTASTGPPG